MTRRAALRTALLLACWLPAAAWILGGAPCQAEDCYRFVDLKEAKNAWKATARDYKTEPYGLSVFIDLTLEEYTAMNQARANDRQKISTVFKVDCSTATSNDGTVTRNPVEPAGWIADGAAKHAVINAVPPDNTTQAKYNASVAPKLKELGEEILTSGPLKK